MNFATSGYSRYSATNLNDILSTQTNSTVSYSKNWAGTPFSLSANMAISQNSQNKTISITLPTMVFNVSRFYPFKRKEKQGKDRWYEKISMQYTGKMTNSVTTTESEVFSKETLENMKNGIEHSISRRSSSSGTPSPTRPTRCRRTTVSTASTTTTSAFRPPRRSTACTTSRRRAATARSRRSATR